MLKIFPAFNVPAARTELPAQSSVLAAGTVCDLVVLLLLALGVRLAALPYATADSFDHAARIWAAWRWIDDPFPLTWGVWGPLHYYLMGPLVALFGPLHAPTLLHVGLGALLPPLLYLFTRREFGSRAGALLAGAATALYPVAILNSLSVRSETPFAVLLVLAMLALSKVRERHALPWAALAGAALTLAGGLRYEAWMLMPFLALVLWPDRRAMALFVAVGLVWPVLAMASNLAVYGDPLHGFTWASHHELVRMGKGALPLTERLGLGLKFALHLVAGLTPGLALLAMAGAALCVVQRRRAAAWLIPVGGLTVLLCVATVRGSLVPKLNYTETLGLFLIPYVAAVASAAPVRRAGRAGMPALGVALLGSMALLLVVGTLRDLPGMRTRSALVARVPAVSPVPMFQGQAELGSLLPPIRHALASGPGRGYVSNFLGFVPTGYLALGTRAHPDRIFLMVAATGDQAIGEGLPLRRRPIPLIGNLASRLEEFLEQYPEGVVVLRQGSPLAEQLGAGSGRAAPQFRDLQLAELARVSVPAPAEPRHRSDGPDDTTMEVVAYRYRVQRPPA
jgi:hypothetical protein